jgi:hypothetical protein
MGYHSWKRYHPAPASNVQRRFPIRSPIYSGLSILIAAALLAQPVQAFQSPLSDESVREAYFLGQRHDNSFELLLDKYTNHLPAPNSGPYISSITFLTPFVMAARLSSSHTGNYSAQQAALDHRNVTEMVQIIVEIQLTATYGQIAATVPANSRSASSAGVILRQGDFWKDFQVHIKSGELPVSISASRGHPNYSCSEEGGCSLIGATLEFDLPAAAFSSDSASITVDPPEGERVTTEFDPASLR